MQCLTMNEPESNEQIQDMLKRRREKDRLRREWENTEHKDAKFVNVLRMCLPLNKSNFIS